MECREGAIKIRPKGGEEVEKSVIIAIVAVAISTASIFSSIALRPATLAPLVTRDEIAEGAVSGDKIAKGTITDANLSPAGISRVARDAIGTDQIADNAITAEKIAQGAIPEYTIGDNEVTSAKIQDGTITDVDISAGANIEPNKISGTAWTSTNDGSGSGLDADMVDGVHGTSFLRSDTSGTINGNLTVNGSITHQTEIRYLNIPYCAFRPGKETEEYQFYNYAGEGYCLINTNPGYMPIYYRAPVNLPHGATVTEVQVRYHLPDPAAGLSVELGREPSMEEMVDIDLPSTTAFTTHSTTSISYPTINNRDHSYYVVVGLAPNDSYYDVYLQWVRITYEVNKPLP
jgi:hypothetical protein